MIQQWFQRIGQAGQIPIHQLPLQRNGGGGNNHRAVGFLGVGDGGHQIGQRFTGARASLHGKMPLGLQCCGDGLGHGDLARSSRAAQCRDCGGE